MKTRLLLIAAFCSIAALTLLQPATALESKLGIGSKAPDIDVEHWIQDGNGFFKPVTKFKEGHIYVVEFWATWCGPCIQSMPHLAELQQKYRGQKVQIISISDESVDEIKALLSQTNEQVGKSFADITSAYSLTTDPDRSVYTDYMDASDQQGIPTSFIVGKTGLIEWIGHPMGLDEPLEAILAGDWDREAFKKQLEAQQQFEENIQKVSMLAGAGKFEQALALIEQQLKEVENEELRQEWISVRYSFKLSAGQVDDEVLAYYRKNIKRMKGDPFNLGRFAYSLVGVAQDGAKVGPLASETATALSAEVKDAEDDLKPFLLNTIALLHDVDGNLEAAIDAQKKAMEVAEERQKKRLMPYLNDLNERLKKQGEKKEK